VITRISAGAPPGDAIATVFGEQFGSSPVGQRQKKAEKQPRSSHYENNRDTIMTVFADCKGNLSATERKLQAMGIKCSRRWLSDYLTRWGCRNDPSS
jgi:hypothetical protein